MIRKIAAIVIGAFVAIALIAAVEYLSHQVYPPPSGIDIADPAAMKAYADSVPIGALLFIGAAWMIGTFGGGMLATFIAGEAAVTNCAIIGGLVLAGTIMTLISITHPVWFSIASIVAIIATTFITSKTAVYFIEAGSEEQNTT
jgi:hypothetical protein